MTKELNWQAISSERKLEYAQKYILKFNKNTGKLQDWRRIEHQTPSTTPEQMIENAINTKVLA